MRILALLTTQTALLCSNAFAQSWQEYGWWGGWCKHTTNNPGQSPLDISQYDQQWYWDYAHDDTKNNQGFVQCTVLNAYKVSDWDADINDDCSREESSTYAWYLVFDSSGNINWNASYCSYNGEGIDQFGDWYYFGGTDYGASSFNNINRSFRRFSCPDTGRSTYTYSTNSRHKWRGSGTMYEIDTVNMPYYSGTKVLTWQGWYHAYTEALTNTPYTQWTSFSETAQGIPWGHFFIATGTKAPSTTYALFNVSPLNL